MNRKDFISLSLLSGTALSFGFRPDDKKTHLLSLSFDDGFKKSFYKIAEIHEAFSLQACLNIIAGSNIPDLEASPNGMPELTSNIYGNFKDWNILKERGHEIMPHTWQHVNLTEIPINEAKERIDKCLDYFEEHLNGFNCAESVFNFAYNASNEALETHALKRVRAIRTGGWNVLNNQKNNPHPSNTDNFKLGCWGYGPGNGDQYLHDEINEFLAGSGGWLIINLHGLDDEGWGPVSSEFLRKKLAELVKVSKLEILPVGQALKKYS